MTHVFHRNNLASYPVAVKGDGVYIIDRDGKRYLDACCGAAVSCLGHSNEEVRQAIKDQVDAIAFAHTGFFTSQPMEQLADFLIKKAPKGFDRVYFVSGGSEAVEASIKLARQYFVDKGQTQRKYVIARWQSYHGNTLGALATGGNRWRREKFSPLLVEVAHVSECYEYRGKMDDETAFAYGQRVANELEQEIVRLGEDKVMAFIAEPVVGATMGCVPAVEGYFKRIREICDKYGVLLILDEIMCGLGRTGSLFACEQEGAVPDIITVAKGLGGGYQPIGAAIVSKNIYDVITAGSGFFQHGHTYVGHATACAAALKVQQVIERDKLVDRVRLQGEKLKNTLITEFTSYPYIGNIRGKGLFIGIEIVKDKETKQPFTQEEKINAKLKASAFEKGLMMYAMGGTIDGKNGDHIMFMPPFIIEDIHIEQIIDTLRQVFADVFKDNTKMRPVLQENNKEKMIL